MIKKILFLIMLNVILPGYLFPQVKTDFINIYKNLISPPSDCREASEMTITDSLTTKIIPGEKISSMENDLKKIQSEISKDLLNFKKMDDNFRGPPRNMPPPGQGGPPSDEFAFVKEKTDKCRDASDSIMACTNRIKIEIEDVQKELNAEIKNTDSGNAEGRLLLVNVLLMKVKSIYHKYYAAMFENVKIIENAFSGTEKTEMVKLMPVKMALLKSQESEIYGAMFLLNVTRECAKTGTKFFNEAKFIN